MQKMQDTPITTEVSLKGFVRVAVVDPSTGMVVSDTDFVRNKITATGFQYMVCNPLLVTNTVNQSNPNYMGLGSQNAVISSSFSNFETTGTAMSMVASDNKAAVTSVWGRTTDCGIVRLVGKWAGASYVNGASCSFNAIGVFNTSGVGAGNVALCAASFSPVTWSSANDIWATYELRFTQ